MKKKIVRAKQFVQRNSRQIAFNSGVLVGSAVTTYVLIRKINADVYLSAAPEKLQQLIDDPSGALCFDGNPMIVLYNEANPLLSK
jgi:hypothetical protein